MTKKEESPIRKLFEREEEREQIREDNQNAYWDQEMQDWAGDAYFDFHYDEGDK